MNELVLVAGIAALASGLTYAGVPLAERYEAPHRIVGAALQFAAGIITALVAVTLMPPAMRNGPYVLTVLAFFAGGTSMLWRSWPHARPDAAFGPGAGMPTRASLRESEVRAACHLKRAAT